MKIISLLLISILLFGCASTPNRSAPTVPVASTQLPAQPNSLALSTPTKDLGQMSAFATETSPTPLPTAMVQNDSNECENAFYPVADGATWDYKLSSGVEATHSMAVDDNNAFTITVTGGDSTFTVDGKCTDEGIVIMEAPGATTTYSGEQGSSVVSTADVSGVTIPKDIKINDTWSQTINVKIGENSSVIQSDYIALGFENISVPAGNFYVLKVEQSGYVEIFGQKINVHGYQWFAEGVGTVMSAMDGAPSVELVSYDIPD